MHVSEKGNIQLIVVFYFPQDIMAQHTEAHLPNTGAHFPNMD